MSSGDEILPWRPWCAQSSIGQVDVSSAFYHHLSNVLAALKIVMWCCHVLDPAFGGLGNVITSEMNTMHLLLGKCDGRVMHIQVAMAVDIRAMKLSSQLLAVVNVTFVLWECSPWTQDFSGTVRSYC